MIVGKKEEQIARKEYGLSAKPAEQPAPAPVEMEKIPERLAELQTEAKSTTKAPPTKRPSFLARQKPIPQPARDEVTRRIEKIMEEGLSDAYARLSPIAQQEFKLRGEQAAVKIRELLTSTHVKVKKIFRLIFEWLKMLPGINRFFLEQEAKIKTDKIIAIKNIEY